MDKTYCGKTSDFIVAEPTFPSIAKAAHSTHSFRMQEMCRKDSLELTLEDRNQLRLAVEQSIETKIIITHGTDTMWKTAAFILDKVAALIVAQQKTVVLCGAMRPAAFKETDAAHNAGMATCAVQLLPPGVHVVMNGEIFSQPLRIYKDLDRNIFYEGMVDRDPNGEEEETNSTVCSSSS